MAHNKMGFYEVLTNPNHNGKCCEGIMLAVTLRSSKEIRTVALDAIGDGRHEMVLGAEVVRLYSTGVQ